MRERNREFILERVVINGDKRKKWSGKIEGNETKRGENASRREDNNEINTQKKKSTGYDYFFSYPPGHLFCSRLGTRCNPTRSNNRTCTAPAYSPGRGQKLIALAGTQNAQPLCNVGNASLCTLCVQSFTVNAFVSTCDQAKKHTTTTAPAPLFGSRILCRETGERLDAAIEPGTVGHFCPRNMYQTCCNGP